MKLHDIIIGDFGRIGTIRYFEAFSNHEKDFISSRFGIEDFFDEHRLVRYTIVGALRDIKESFLPREYSRIDDTVLVGVNGGPKPEEVTPPIVEALIPYVNNAVDMGADFIRIIIPCNTLFRVSKQLNLIFNNPELLLRLIDNHQLRSTGISDLLQSMETTVIWTPVLIEEVVDDLNEPELSTLRVTASRSGIKAYREVAELQDDELAIEPWLPAQIDSFEELLGLSVNGDMPPDLNGTENVQTSDTKLLSGCTDFAIPNTADSVDIFAGRMVANAYSVLQGRMNVCEVELEGRKVR